MGSVVHTQITVWSTSMAWKIYRKTFQALEEENSHSIQDQIQVSEWINLWKCTQWNNKFSSLQCTFGLVFGNNT